jgi:DNA-directed RNA polymerase specialized sigma24 family protein
MLQSHANASQGLVACLLAAIEELSPDQKRIIAELFWREVSETELGRKLGISRRALNKRKHRILRDLRALLPARLPTEPCSKRLGAGISSLPDSKQPP